MKLLKKSTTFLLQIVILLSIIFIGIGIVNIRETYCNSQFQVYPFVLSSQATNLSSSEIGQKIVNEYYANINKGGFCDSYKTSTFSANPIMQNGQIEGTFVLQNKTSKTFRFYIVDITKLGYMLDQVPGSGP